MTGAQALIESLKREQVAHIFGYAGATICPAVDAFFDGVMVMCEDAALRRNRLSMLQALGSRFARLADFAALQL